MGRGILKGVNKFLQENFRLVAGSVCLRVASCVGSRPVGLFRRKGELEFACEGAVNKMFQERLQSFAVVLQSFCNWFEGVKEDWGFWGKDDASLTRGEGD